jgi:hypothetical protein
MTQHHTSEDLNLQQDNTVEASNLTLSILLCFAKHNVLEIQFVFVMVYKRSYSGYLQNDLVSVCVCRDVTQQFYIAVWMFQNNLPACTLKKAEGSYKSIYLSTTPNGITSPSVIIHQFKKFVVMELFKLWPEPTYFWPTVLQTSLHIGGSPSPSPLPSTYHFIAMYYSILSSLWQHLWLSLLSKFHFHSGKDTCQCPCDGCVTVHTGLFSLTPPYTTQAFLCVLCLTLQWCRDLNSNYCPGQTAFKFTSPLNASMT